MEKADRVTTRSLDDFLKDQLKDAEFAAEYLNAFLEDGTADEVAAAMAAIRSARGGMNSANALEPMGMQIQDFLRSTGLRFSAHPGL